MRIEMLALFVVVSGSVAMTSCSMPAPDDPDVTQGSWPSCSWPAALDPLESGPAPDRCFATRTRLRCTLAGGVTETCPTNDPTRCDEENAPEAQECRAECVRNAFSLACGVGGPASHPPPAPAGCQPSLPNASGIVFYCCPCG
jgi:hypothetical protein